MFQSERKQNNLIIHLGQELNYFNATEIKEKIKDLITEKDVQVVLVLSEVEKMDSSGVGVIISLLKYMEGREISLVNPQPKISRVFEITRLDQVIAIHPTLEEALKA